MCGVLKKSQTMKAEKISTEEILKVRVQHIKQDLDLLDSKEKRLREERADLILRLVAQREQLLSLREQDE
jgi:hypothetical protein